MKLADLRKLSIRQQIRIHFRIGNGMECVVTEHGLAQVPGLNTIPDFNLEQELSSAGEFLLEPVTAAKVPAKPRQISREELAGMVAASAPGAAAVEHEEE